MGRRDGLVMSLKAVTGRSEWDSMAALSMFKLMKWNLVNNSQCDSCCVYLVRKRWESRAGVADGLVVPQTGWAWPSHPSSTDHPPSASSVGRYNIFPAMAIHRYQHLAYFQNTNRFNWTYWNLSTLEWRASFMSRSGRSMPDYCKYFTGNYARNDSKVWLNVTETVLILVGDCNVDCNDNCWL